MKEEASTETARQRGTRVSVIIPTFKRDEVLRDVLRDLSRQQEVQGEVVVVDQNTPPIGHEFYPATDGKLGALALRIIQRPPGVVASRNAAAEAAAGEILVFLDDDVRIDDPLFLHRHALNYQDAGIVAVCGQELAPPDFDVAGEAILPGLSPFESAVFFPRNSTRRHEAGVLSTCNCSIRKSEFNKVGGFDAAFCGNSYGDDADLALRLAARGCRVVFDPIPSVRHLKWQKGGLRLSDIRNRSPEAGKYVSAWVFFFRHVPGRWKPWFLWHGILRKSIFLKLNVVRPWRWPAVWAGLVAAMGRGYWAAKHAGK